MRQLKEKEIADLKVKRMSNKTLVFELNGEECFATRTVANQILSHTAKYVFIDHVPDNKANARRAWLLVPSMCFDRPF